MSLRILAPASQPVVTLSEAKAFLRVDTDADDSVITAMIAAVTDWLAGETGWLGRSLAEHVLELRLPAFPCGAIILPRPPLIGVDSVTYVDIDGAEQTLVAETYITHTGSDGLPRISLATGETWPDTGDHPEAVRVIYAAGYAAGSPSEPAIPNGLKQAILMTIARLYEAREIGPAGDDSGLKSLFAPYRVYA